MAGQSSGGERSARSRSEVCAPKKADATTETENWNQKRRMREVW